MLDEYVGEIIKIPSRRIRWGIISCGASCAVGATSTAIGYTAYEVTSSYKDEKIQRFKRKAEESEHQSRVNITKYYGTTKGQAEHLKEVNEALKDWWKYRDPKFTKKL